MSIVLLVLPGLCTGCSVVEKVTRWGGRIVNTVEEKVSEKMTDDSGGYITEEARTYNEAVDDFFNAVDRRDKDAVIQMFSEKVRAEYPQLEALVEELFEAYPGPTDICKRNGRMVAGSYSTDHGKKTAEVSQGFPVVSGDTYYWCDFVLMYRNDEDEAAVGVTRVSLYSERSFCEMRYNPPDRSGMMDKNVDPDPLPLEVEMESELEGEVRWIGGYPVKFTPVDRELPPEMIREFFESSDSYSGFREAFGEPNAFSISGIACFYELPPEDGEPRYLDILFDEEADRILSAYVVNDLDIPGIYCMYE